MLRDEAISLFKKEVTDRIPVQTAKMGEDWYIHSANTIANGKHYPVMEISFHLIRDGKVIPRNVIQMPKGLTFTDI